MFRENAWRSRQGIVYHTNDRCRAGQMIGVNNQIRNDDGALPKCFKCVELDREAEKAKARV